MGRKWGSNEDIHVGDIFDCIASASPFARPDYYQVVALKGRTQVVLHAIHSETYINEGISEDSPLSRYRKRDRPLPGQFMREDEMREIREYRKQGKLIRFAGERVTAWVSPDRAGNGRLLLYEVGEIGRGLGVYYTLAEPKDWEPWDAEAIRKLEEYERAYNEVLREHLNGNKEVPWPEYPL